MRCRSSSRKSLRCSHPHPDPAPKHHPGQVVANSETSRSHCQQGTSAMSVRCVARNQGAQSNMSVSHALRRLPVKPGRRQLRPIDHLCLVFCARFRVSLTKCHGKHRCCATTGRCTLTRRRHFLSRNAVHYAAMDLYRACAIRTRPGGLWDGGCRVTVGTIVLVALFSKNVRDNIEPGVLKALKARYEHGQDER